VTRENENYLVMWDTKYEKKKNFKLTVLLNYCKKGENGTVCPFTQETPVQGLHNIH
jgi:hypothetical protein